MSFSLNKGDHLSIIGVNGSGKSTILKCLYGFLDYEGSVKIDGVEVKKIPSRELSKKITILPQDTTMYFDYKVIDVIKLGRYAHDKWNLSFKEQDSILNKLDIFHLKYRYMSELSGGERQKVFIARVLAQDSDVVLFDELSNNLDIKSQIYILKNLRGWFKNKILITIFHDLNLVNNIDSKIMMIKDSKIYRYGEMTEVFNGNNLNYIYGMDIEKFMISSLEKWKKRTELNK